jgi:hypothetical protein
MNNRKTNLAITLLLMQSIALFSQNASFSQNVQDIAGQIKQVKTADGTIDQKIKVLRDNLVSLEITKTDTKGKSVALTYQWDMADINQKAVKDALSGQVMYVELPVKDNNKYIEVTKDGKFDSYQNTLKITAYDVDNSRAIVSAIQSAIPIAEKMELAKYTFSSQDQLLSALYGAVKGTPDNTIDQKIRSTTDKKEKLDYTSMTEKDKKTSMYEFNLSDINPAKIIVKVSGFLGLFPGKSLTLSVETNGEQKVIKQFENEIPKTYVSGFNISPADVENAKQIKNLLYLAVQNVKSGATALSDFSYSATMASPAKQGEMSPSNSTNNNTKAIPATPIVSITDAEIPIPDFPGRPYYITGSKKLENLERADASSDVKIKGLGYGGHDLYFTAFGIKSPITFKQSELPKLVIKLEANQDPSEMVTLTKATLLKDRRRFLQESGSLGGKAHNVEASRLPLQFRKVRDGLYEIVIPATIEPGEYAFMPMGASGSILSSTTIKISCFSVEQ